MEHLQTKTEATETKTETPLVEAPQQGVEHDISPEEMAKIRHHVVEWRAQGFEPPKDKLYDFLRYENEIENTPPGTPAVHMLVGPFEGLPAHLKSQEAYDAHQAAERLKRRQGRSARAIGSRLLGRMRSLLPGRRASEPEPIEPDQPEKPELVNDITAEELEVIRPHVVEWRAKGHEPELRDMYDFLRFENDKKSGKRVSMLVGPIKKVQTPGSSKEAA